jgi:hypothetical protein
VAQQRTILTFEEGTAGSVIDAATAILKPPKWDDSGSTLLISGGRYTTGAHSGSLAASLDSTLGGGTINVTAASRYSVGGGGWVKSHTPPSFAGDPIASVQFENTSNPSLGRGIGVYYNAGNLEARVGFTVLATTPYVADRWMQLSLAPSGTWTVTDASGGTLMSGSITAAEASPYDAFVFFAQAGTAGAAIVDDVWLWWDGGPAVRLYPRDDGRGMSSAPRLWPPQKNRRIIGGYP